MFPFSLPPRYTYNGTRLEGGQGYVYICHDTYLDRPVAIKVMKKIADADILKNELASLRDVRSPHIAEVYDLLFARRSAMAGLVQEYVPGACLSEVAETDLAADQLLRVLWQVASGIADIHAHGKVHRDIKPSNIRLDAEQVIKILDFGIASEFATGSVTINVRGTRVFSAPELYGTPPVKISPAMDVYSFGVTAWYLISHGHLPQAFFDVPPGSQEPMPSFVQFQAQLPPMICALLDLTLSLDPAKRPPMYIVRAFLANHILSGRHRATARYGSTVRELSTPGDSINLAVGNDSAVIRYNGFDFRIQSVVGDVYINNARAVQNGALPSSCVITLGSRALGWDRTFVPIDMSHPEVVL